MREGPQPYGKIRLAREWHTCELCNNRIDVGEKYFYGYYATTKKDKPDTYQHNSIHIHLDCLKNFGIAPR